MEHGRRGGVLTGLERLLATRRPAGSALLALTTTLVLAAVALAGCAPVPIDPLPKLWFEAPTASRDVTAAMAAATPAASASPDVRARIAQDALSAAANWFDARDSEPVTPTIVTSIEAIWGVGDTVEEGRGLEGIAVPGGEYLYEVAGPSGSVLFESTWSVRPGADSAWGTRALQARGPALDLLWRHFGRVRFKYAIVDSERPGTGTWVLGETRGHIAGVFVGPTQTLPGVGGGSDEQIAQHVRPGTLLADDTLVQMFGSKLMGGYGP